MCSVDIVIVINEEREAGRAELRHDHFIAKIEKHPGIDAPKFRGVYKGGNGQDRPCYYLPKREAELMVMSESLKVQTRVYDRLAAIEAGTLPAAAPAPRRATGGNRSLDSFRQARALDIVTGVADRICAKFPSLGAPAQQGIYATLVNGVVGQVVIPLPKIERMYNATEVGAKFGVNRAVIGRLAKAHGVKIDKYGEWLLDKSQSSEKQVENFHYNEAGVARIGELLGHGGKPAPGGQAQLGFDPPAAG
jgi:hypothetical protein